MGRQEQSITTNRERGLSRLDPSLPHGALVEARIKHHRNVLIRPGLQVLLCLDGIQLCGSLLSHTIHPVVNSFLPLAEMGSRVKQVAFKGMKEKRGKENTESKGRNGEASTTVHRPRSHWLY